LNFNLFGVAAGTQTDKPGDGDLILRCRRGDNQNQRQNGEGRYENEFLLHD